MRETQLRRRVSDQSQLGCMLDGLPTGNTLLLVCLSRPSSYCCQIFDLCRCFQYTPSCQGAIVNFARRTVCPNRIQRHKRLREVGEEVLNVGSATESDNKLPTSIVAEECRLRVGRRVLEILHSDSTIGRHWALVRVRSGCILGHPQEYIIQRGVDCEDSANCNESKIHWAYCLDLRRAASGPQHVRST